VNNGIVLTDVLEELPPRRWDLHAAAVEAGRSRLRPILMTTLTTVLGMVRSPSDRGRRRDGARWLARSSAA
jgi:HAE1 family hydrophobic/amphiphilic exporter-1